MTIGTPTINYYCCCYYYYLSPCGHCWWATRTYTLTASKGSPLRSLGDWALPGVNLEMWLRKNVSSGSSSSSSSSSIHNAKCTNNAIRYYTLETQDGVHLDNNAQLQTILINSPVTSED